VRREIEESSAYAEHGTFRQTVISERPEGKERLSTLAHGCSDLPPHSEIILQDDAQYSHIYWSLAPRLAEEGEGEHGTPYGISVARASWSG